MQNKGAIKLLAVALTLVSLYQLSFTLIANRVRSHAHEYAKGDTKKETIYLDSISGESVYNFFWIKHFTFKECQEREMNLGLDLKGGMNVTLEVSVIDLIKSMSGNSKDTTFNKAIHLAQEYQKNPKYSGIDFVTLFGKAFETIDKNGKMSVVFNTPGLSSRINFNSTNSEVLKVIKQECDAAIDNSFNILRSRIDRFGVAQPNIQRLQTTGRILVELPGIKEPDRVRKLLQGTANLEFWATYDNQEVFQFLKIANDRLKDLKEAHQTLTEPPAQISVAKDTTKTITPKKDEVALLDKMNKDTTKGKDSSLVNKLGKDSTKANASMEEFQKANPLFAILRPKVDNEGKLLKGAAVGISHFKDTSKVNYYLNLPQIRGIFPPDVKFAWEIKALPYDKTNSYFQLVAIKVTKRDGTAALTGDVITNAREEYGQNKATAEVTMSMNGEGSREWARITKDNIGKDVAIVLDGYVYSHPVVQSEIRGGSSQITGNFTITEAKDLANILKSGKMPAPAKIIEESVVGPTLGKEAISVGLISFILAFIGVLLYMSLYYNGAGHVADFALLANVFFQFGTLASLNAVLTLPGIAGIVLTLAMAVDSNVIIYERMREEIRAGKGMKLVVKDGFQHAYSAIIDGHVTTILTGIVLFVFGSGPVQGFATTLIIGLVLSLFSSIFIARLAFEWMLEKNMEITVGNKYTLNAFTKTKIDFIGIRKTMYIASGILIGIGIISLFVRGLSYGVDFTGGRTYIVRFDQDVKTQDIRTSLAAQDILGEAPEVKTFGPNTQVKITTKYLINSQETSADSLIEAKLYQGLKTYYKTPLSYSDFIAHADKKDVGRMSSQKVGPTVAADLVYQAFMAVFFGLVIIFIYITIRFRNWQYGLGGVVSLAHDSLVVITFFTLFHGILPFSLEVDQSFIAAILTVIGYSIMDSVIIFDRIREYTGLHPKWTLQQNINAAINSTLGRTVNTSGITLVVLIVIFIFGGEVLRGFIFALLVGVAIGTYSSVFNATPVAYDVIEWRRKLAEKRNAKKGKVVKTDA